MLTHVFKALRGDEETHELTKARAEDCASGCAQFDRWKEEVKPVKEKDEYAP